MTPPTAFARALEAQQGGEPDLAIDAYREAITDDPDLAPAHFNLGQIYRQAGRHGEAAECFRAATRLRPTAADAWLNLGVSLELVGDLTDAVEAFRRARQVDPADGTAAFNVANVLKKQGDLPGACDAYLDAVGLHPASPEVQLNLGNTLRELGDAEGAVEALRTALTLRPDWVEAQWNLALALLAAGRLNEGWEMYHARWAHQRLAPDRGLPWPVWEGQRLGGKRILVWREQGVGDDLLFATCIGDLVAQGARVTLAVDQRLVPLLDRAFPEVEVVADHDWGDDPFHYQVSLGSLPRWTRPSRASFHSPWSLTLPDRGRIRPWAERLRTLGTGQRVGLCWRSGVRTADRVRHYAQLEDYAPLFALPGLIWVNLQYDADENELEDAETRFGTRFGRWPDVDLRNDFETLAAMIWNLDVVITAPTAVSSLAGALGVETWQIDSGNDWTALGADRSPWFPAIRLFRRPAEPGGWGPVMDAVRTELALRSTYDPGPMARTGG